MHSRLAWFLVGLFTAQALAWAAFDSPEPEISNPEFLSSQAVNNFYLGDHAKAEQNFAHGARVDQARLEDLVAFLFERQDYAAVEKNLVQFIETMEAGKREISPLWHLLARAQANQGKWLECGQSLAAWKGLATRPAALRLAAEAADIAGNSTVAKKAWDEALAATGREKGAALTHLKAGRFFKRYGFRKLAQEQFQKAEKADNAYSQVHSELAVIYREEGRYAAAKSRMERAAGFDPQDRENSLMLLALLKDQPFLVKTAKKDLWRKERGRFDEANVRVVPVTVPAGTPSIRIGLLSKAPGFKFRTGGDMSILKNEGGNMKTIGRLEGGRVFDVALRGRMWRIKVLSPLGKRHEKVVLRFKHSIKLVPLLPEATTRVFDVSYGAGYFWSGSEDRFYRGMMELMPRGVKGVTLVNEVSLEEYLMGTVPAEIPSSWPMQALRAQAIAARTTAWQNRGKFKAEGFDLCPTVSCAVYKGVTAEHPRTNSAVHDSEGEVIENPETSKLFPVFYMSNSGGHTQNPQDAWKWDPGVPSSAVFDGPPENIYASRFPLSPLHLLSWLDDFGPDPVESYSRLPQRQPLSSFRWVAQYDADRLERFVKRRHPDIGDLLSVETLNRSDAGYVKRVNFVGSKGSSIGSSDYIRSAIKGLKSNLFYVETRRDSTGKPIEFLFHGGGWGHGVGLCQTGAAGMAEHDFTGEQIVLHYFPGGKINKRY